jgi:hypothetical protein
MDVIMAEVRYLFFVSIILGLDWNSGAGVLCLRGRSKSDGSPTLATDPAVHPHGSLQSRAWHDGAPLNCCEIPSAGNDFFLRTGSGPHVRMGLKLTLIILA